MDSFHQIQHPKSNCNRLVSCSPPKINSPACRRQMSLKFQGSSIATNITLVPRVPKATDRHSYNACKCSASGNCLICNIADGSKRGQHGLQQKNHSLQYSQGSDFLHVIGKYRAIKIEYRNIKNSSRMRIFCSCSGDII